MIAVQIAIVAANETAPAVQVEVLGAQVPHLREVQEVPVRAPVHLGPGHVTRRNPIAVVIAIVAVIVDLDQILVAVLDEIAAIVIVIAIQKETRKNPRPRKVPKDRPLKVRLKRNPRPLKV